MRRKMTYELYTEHPLRHGQVDLPGEIVEVAEQTRHYLHQPRMGIRPCRGDDSIGEVGIILGFLGAAAVTLLPGMDTQAFLSTVMVVAMGMSIGGVLLFPIGELVAAHHPVERCAAMVVRGCNCHVDVVWLWQGVCELALVNSAQRYKRCLRRGARRGGRRRLWLAGRVWFGLDLGRAVCQGGA